MKRLKWLIRRIIFFTLLIIAGVMIYKTITFKSKQIKVTAVEPIKIVDSAVSRLSDVVQIPTTSYEGYVDTAAFIAFKSYLDSTFLLVDSLLEKTVVNNFSLTYKWPGKNPKLSPILLMGHIDVVPVENESAKAWTYPPYSGKIADKYIWGRGTLDDKVSILGILEAITVLLKEEYQPERTIYLAFGHDEEISGFNGAKAIARMFKQQGLQFEYVLDEGMVIIEDALPGLDKPVALIGNAEKGYTTLKLTAKLPKGGHSSMPPKETAIGILSQAITTLQNRPFPARIDGPASTLFAYTGPEMNPLMKTIFANTWLFKGLLTRQLEASPSSNAMLRTTTAPTMLESGVKDNVLPSKATAKINFRILPGETIQTVKEYVIETIDDERIEVTFLNEAISSNPSSVSETGSFGFRVIERTAHEIFPGIVSSPSLAIAATDSRHYYEVSNQIFRFLPVQMTREDTKRIHGINERIGIEDYKNLIRFYHRLILNSCK